MTTHPKTPDGRYFVVRGRLWRCTNPSLNEQSVHAWTQALMQARRDVRAAMMANNADALAKARADVNSAKCALGERGPVWWSDNAPDYNRKMAKNSPYKGWYERLYSKDSSNVVN